jgi:two-component sensor histidine kinase
MNPPQKKSLQKTIQNLCTYLCISIDVLVKEHSLGNDFEILEHLSELVADQTLSVTETKMEQEIEIIQEVLFSYSQRDFSKKLAVSEKHSNLDALKLTINIQGEELEDLFLELEQKQAVEAQNREKEILLKEIHHRVKNNLQVITSLLGLQGNTIVDPKVKNIFKSSQHRINSIALVHELLYQSDNISKTDSASYFQQLSTSLIHSYKGFEHDIHVKIQSQKLLLNIDTAIPLGLIINEIITNSLKYGIEEEGILYIYLKKINAQQFQLDIGDYGKGIPKDLNIKKTKSLGLKLIHKLIIQLNGTIEHNLDKGKGCHYRIVFEEV